MNRKQYEKWSTIRKKGRRHFIWFQGVLFWGIITGIMWSVAMAYYSPSEHIYIRPMIALTVFPISGYFGSKWTWNRNEQKYGDYDRDNK